MSRVHFFSIFGEDQNMWTFCKEEHYGSPVISYDSILKTWSPKCYQWWANQEESGENLQNGKQSHVFLSFSKFEIGDNYQLIHGETRRRKNMVFTSSEVTSSVLLAWPAPRLHAWAHHSGNSCYKSHLKLFTKMCLFFKWMLGHVLAGLTTGDIGSRPNFHRLTCSHIFCPSEPQEIYSFIRQD